MERSASAPPSSPASARDDPVELAIVGAGPVGLYATYYAGFRGLTTLLLESLPIVGGQISTFYPDEIIYDVAGFPEIRGQELVARLIAQADRFPRRTVLGEEVTAIEKRDGMFHLTSLATGRAAGRPARVHAARAVLLTAGIGSFSPQRLVDPTVARFEGAGVTYYDPDAAAARGAHVLVIGGSRRAVELALRLSPDAAAVTLAHRRDRLQVDPPTRARLDAPPVRFLPFREIERLEGGERVARASLIDRRDGSRIEVETTLVVLCYGFHARAEALARFGVALEGDAVRVDSRMASNVAGIYAAGDGATYPGKVRVLAADFGEACTAINNIAAAIVPGASVFPGYSSHRRGSARRASR